MDKFENNRFSEAIRKKILDGDFKEKEDLMKFLKVAMSDSFVLQSLKEDNIVLDQDELENISKKILEYYDKTKTDLTSLNLDGISQFEVGENDYIKVKNEDGTYDVLDDSMNDKTFVEQMQERQNESINLQTADGVKNREEIIKDMKEDKKEAVLTSSTSVDVRELTPEERRKFMAVMRMNDADKINFVVDPVRNIYINRDTGETYYVNKNQFNQMEVRKAEEATVQTIKEDVSYVGDDGIEKTTVMENIENSEFENLDEYELQYIVDNRFDSLTPEQKEIVMQILQRKKEMKINDGEKLVNQNQIGGRQYVKSMFNQPYNGFANILLLSFVTLLSGLMMLGYLIFKINS